MVADGYRLLKQLMLGRITALEDILEREKDNPISALTPPHTHTHILSFIQGFNTGS